MTGGEVVVEGYGPGDPPGGAALAELSGRELKGWSGCSRRGLPGRKEVGDPRVGTARERRRSSASLTLLLRLGESGRSASRPGSWTGDGLLHGLHPSATTTVRLYLLHSLTGRSQ